MAAYSISHDTSYQYLAAMKDGEVRKVPRFNGKSIQDKWYDIQVSLKTEDFNVLGVVVHQEDRQK